MIRVQAVKHYSERGAGTPPQNFKTGNFSRSCTDRGIKQPKSFVDLFNGSRTKALPLCMSLEPTLQTSRGVGQRPGNRRFFSLAFPNNAKHCSREVLRSCKARLPSVTAKKNFMLNRRAIQRRLRSLKEKRLRL